MDILKSIHVFQRHGLLSWICKPKILKTSKVFYILKFLLGAEGEQLLSKFYIVLYN